MARHENDREYTPDDKPYQGTLISVLRHGVNKSVKGFAEEVSIDPASLSKIENNRARISKFLLSRIAKKLDVTTEELLAAPIHPRLERETSVQKTRTLISIGDQINEMITEANLSTGQQRLAEQLILDTSRAIILRLGVFNKS